MPFSHPVPLGIGYFFHDIVHVSYQRVCGIEYLVQLFLSYLMPLDIGKLAHKQRVDLRIKEDYGISG